MQTWELNLSLASVYQAPTRVFVPIRTIEGWENTCEAIGAQFGLRQGLVDYVPVMSVPDGGDIRKVRDIAVIDSADVIVPVSLRPGSSLESLLMRAETEDRQVDRRFLIPYEKRSDHLAYSMPSEAVRESLDSELAEYLIHWTRSCRGAWPDERAIDYYRAVIESTEYCRSAYQTLVRIVRTGKVLASARHMPGGTDTVSYTSLPPTSLLPLMTWRARYREMAFEPYGLGISREYAEKVGIRPVVYYDKALQEPPDTCPRWLTQSSGEITDWRREQEWRHEGDIDLSAIPSEALIAVCRTASEAEALTRDSGIRATSFLP